MKALGLPVMMLACSLALPCSGQEAAVEVVRVKCPGFPHVDKSATAGASAKMKLTLEAQTGDDFYDGKGYTSQRDMFLPGTTAGPAADAARGRTGLGALKFLRPLSDGFHLAVYVSSVPLAKGLLKKSDAEIYDKTYSYKVAVLNASNKVVKAFDLTEFFHPILEMSTAQVVGTILYFDASYNGYANITKGKTGYMVAFDWDKGLALWTSPALTTSYGGFVVVGDHIVTGYGFTAEPDFVYLLNRHSGVVVQKEKLKSAPERFAVSGNRVYVKCYEGSYVFEF